MAADLAGLDDLVEHVNAQHPGGYPVVHLGDAVLTARRLDDLADQLIGYFVGQARRSGVSWRAIGEAMGISKQAAQKRFAPSLPGVDLPDGAQSRLTARVRRAGAAARREALAMGLGQVGTEHLLLGLISEPEGMAAQAIVALGVTPEQIRARVGAGPAPDAAAAPEPIPFSPPARTAFELGLREALHRGHNYIGTGHLLLGILADEEGAGATVLTDFGITRKRAGGWISQAVAR